MILEEQGLTDYIIRRFKLERQGPGPGGMEGVRPPHPQPEQDRPHRLRREVHPSGRFLHHPFGGVPSCRGRGRHQGRAHFRRFGGGAAVRHHRRAAQGRRHPHPRRLREPGHRGQDHGGEFARENKVPFLGVCLGFQIATIEFARNVLGMSRAPTAPSSTRTPLTRWWTCSRSRRTSPRRAPP